MTQNQEEKMISTERHVIRHSIAVALLALLLLAPFEAANAFDAGRTSASLMISPGRQLDRDCTVLAGRIGRYFVQDFEASLTVEAWRGNDPAIYKVMPELRYAYSRAGPVKPYVGIFVSRTLYDGLPDRNTYGLRAGTYITFNPSAHLAVGATFERIEGCDASVYRKCRQIYPELGLHFIF
jgi:hypothetical protein